MTLRNLSILALLSVASAPALAQDLLIPDRLNQRVLHIRGSNGTVVTANFIVDGGPSGAYDFVTPREVLQLPPYLFVLDTDADAVFRFRWNGTSATFDAKLQPGIDEALGIAADPSGLIYIANNGGNNGAPGVALVRMTPTGTVLPPLPIVASRLEDVAYHNGELVVADSISNVLRRYSLSGAALGTVSNGTAPITTPRSCLTALASTDLIVATGGGTTGVHRFTSAFAGLSFASWAFWSVGAAADLSNGNYILTGPAGLATLNPNSGGFSFLTISGGIQPGLFSRFDPAANCGSIAVSYCTAGTNTAGCTGSISASGTASASASSGFTLSVNGVEGQRLGLIFYGLSGPAAQPWGTSSSFLCVKSPTQRMDTQDSGGSVGLCDGSYSQDWNAFLAAHPSALGSPRQAGQAVHAQAWFRDPPSPKTTHLSNALEFFICP
ncbi:MAG: hypothetical protein NTV21_18065 [Planctomycetota bacterium]|nr:hypothetical protein [Planctomycetota bacterium]